MGQYIEDIDITEIEEVEREAEEGENELRFNENLILRTEYTIYQKPYRRLTIPYDATDQLHFVTAGEVGRLDLIARKWYNNLNLWWVIAETNSIKDPLDFEAGIALRIPTLARIFLEII